MASHNTNRLQLVIYLNNARETLFLCAWGVFVVRASSLQTPRQVRILYTHTFGDHLLNLCRSDETVQYTLSRTLQFFNDE